MGAVAPHCCKEHYSEFTAVEPVAVQIAAEVPDESPRTWPRTSLEVFTDVSQEAHEERDVARNDTEEEDIDALVAATLTKAEMVSPCLGPEAHVGPPKITAVMTTTTTTKIAADDDLVKRVLELMSEDIYSSAARVLADEKQITLERPRMLSLGPAGGEDVKMDEFQVVLDSGGVDASDRRLGCKVRGRPSTGLTVMNVRQNSLLEAWNVSNPRKEVLPRDLIISVNGVQGVAEFLMEQLAKSTSSSSALELVVQGRRPHRSGL